MVEHLQERLVPAQLVVDDGHVGGEELTGDVGEPAGRTRSEDNDGSTACPNPKLLFFFFLYINFILKVFYRI